MPRIAVIDTDEDLLGLATELFRDEGWQTLPVRGGDVALATIRHDRPDVILLDLWLDHAASGWTVLRQLHTDLRTQRIPVIIWTGAADFLTEEQASLVERGIQWVTKPCDIDDLLTSVRTALSQDRGWQANGLAAGFPGAGPSFRCTGVTNLEPCAHAHH